MKNKEKKKWSAKKTALLVLGAVLLLLLLVVVTLVSSLLMKYNKTSYEYEPPVEREDEYVMPDYPEVTFTSSDNWEDGTDETVTETATPTAEAPEESEKETADSLFDESESPESANETEEIVEIIAPPAETLAPVINTPASQTNSDYTPTSNPDASFANSTNAVSVYGKVPIYKVSQIDTDVTNILIMGTDSRDVTLDRGRSDTMIVASYNAKTGSVKLTSLLRDSLVPIEGHGWNRINTAYFYGGVGLAINTVNQLYNLDIQQFIVIDFNGTRNFIDYIGGVDINLTKEEAELYSIYTGKNIPEGLNHLDSNLALTHMRNRAIGNDFGRTQRQRDTIIAILQQVMTQKSVTEIYDIVDYSFSLIKTNIAATDLVSLAASVLTNASKLQLETQNVPYSDAYQFAQYNGMSILSYDITAAAKRLHTFLYGN